MRIKSHCYCSHIIFMLCFFLVPCRHINILKKNGLSYTYLTRGRLSGLENIIGEEKILPSSAKYGCPDFLFFEWLPRPCNFVLQEQFLASDTPTSPNNSSPAQSQSFPEYVLHAQVCPTCFTLAPFSFLLCPMTSVHGHIHAWT